MEKTKTKDKYNQVPPPPGGLQPLKWKNNANSSDKLTRKHLLWQIAEEQGL